MEKNEFFSYSWHLDEDETNRTVIRIYGLNPKNENVCVIVNNFLPYAYLELPDTILWNDAKASLVASRLNSMLGENKPVTYKLEYKKRLYYANLDKKLSKRIYPYIQCCCSHPEDIRQLGYKIRRPINIPGIGAINLKIHEHNASPILQLTSKQKLPTAGWISFLGKKIAKAEQITHCEHEYIVKCENLQEKNSNVVARPLMMGYDIEVNSSIPSSMPKAHRPDDKIFQISCVFGRQGSKPDTYEKYILSLGEPDPDMLEDIEIRMYDTESDLLLGFTEIIQEKQPNIIIGYNIFTFDIPYMIDRAKLQYCIYDFDRQGMTKYGHAKERNIEWSSSAYKNQSFQFLDAEGRIFVDLLPLVKRDYKMNNYKLKTIASHFLKDMTKDPLDAKGIFKCYRLGMQGGPRGRKALAIVGKYCVKDSELVVRLCETLTTWFALCEMSKVTNVPIFSLYTQGQQLKVFSNAYKKCTNENIVVEKDAYVAGENDHYVGATVFPPVPGVYEKVIPFDFSALYPSTIIAYNISWDTLVLDKDIPDDICHVMEWDDHINCEHDPKEIRKSELNKIIKEKESVVKELRKERDLKKNKDRKEEFKERIDVYVKEMKPFRDERSQLQKSKAKHLICCKRKYRWLKSPMGVLPEILTHLLETRSATKKEMKKVAEKLKEMKEDTPEYNEMSTYHDVLDQRQLALKVSSNSGYGCLGVKRGYLPLMPGAMATTYMGRKAIEKAAESIQKDWGGVLVYGDSVSGDTPILVKYPNGSINLQTIDTLGNEWVDYDQYKSGDKDRNGKEQSFANLEVWTNGKWSRIRKVIRHKTVKKMYRILTHTGCVDVTEDHSLLREDGEKVKPTEVKIGEPLLHSFPSTFEEFETEMVEGLNNETHNISELTKEEAFVWGYFLANGSVSNSIWEIKSKNFQTINNCKNYLEKVEPLFSFGITDNYVLFPVDKAKLLAEKYHQIVYDKNKRKIVPYPVLNGSREIKEWFLLGYKDENNVIECEDKVGLQGFYLLLKSIGIGNIILEDSYRIKIEEIKDSKTAIKKIIPLADTTYTDYVYDLETEEGIFHAGIGELVVKNTDSNYVNFPQLKSAQECWDYSIKVAKEVSSLFPKPMSLAFEEKVYWRFFILTKKRYMSQGCKRDGVLDKEIGKKGVLLQRRDNCSFVRKIYGDVVMMIFNKRDREDIVNYILDELNKLCGAFYPVNDFVVTKSIGEVGELEPHEGKDKNDKPCYKIGDYKVKLLPTDERKREQQFKLKNCSSEKDYYLRSLPAQVQLAEKMRERGQLVSAGSRLEYVITTTGGHTAKQYIKVEDRAYFSKHSGSLSIDYLYYLKQLSNPLDQILDIIFSEHEKGFILKQYKYRLQVREKVLSELRGVFTPRLMFNGK